MAVRIFEEKEHAAVYAKYRPTYPGILYDTITRYYEDGRGPTCNYDRAVDVGSGSGQSTRPLTKYFKRVTGIDISAEQIAMANAGNASAEQIATANNANDSSEQIFLSNTGNDNAEQITVANAGRNISAQVELDVIVEKSSRIKVKRDQNLTYMVGCGEDLTFLDNVSADIVTAAQCLHWFDRETFYIEATRVLKPGGVLAVYGYGGLHVDNREAQTVVDEFLYDVLGPHWEKGRWHIHNMYRDISLPFPGWQRVENNDLVIRMSTTVDDLVGYLSSISHWRKLLKLHPDADHLQHIRSRLMKLYGVSEGVDQPTIIVTWDIFLLLGRKPK